MQQIQQHNVGRSVFLGSATPILQGGVAGNTGVGGVSRGQPRLQSQESGVPGLPNFWGSPEFTYAYTPFNAERQN